MAVDRAGDKEQCRPMDTSRAGDNRVDPDPRERLGVVRDHPAPLRRCHSGARTRTAEHCDVRLPSSVVGKTDRRVERVGRGIGVGFCGTGSGVTGRVGGLGVRLNGVRWGGGTEAINGGLSV